MALAMPLIGLGTWDLRGAECVGAVETALDIGYRHIDTAQMYENEREVGRGVAGSRVARGDVFITTKLWRDNLTREAVPRSFDASLRRLGTDYVDLLLIHWPNDDVPLAETLEAMDRLREAGRARAIGVSNFPSRRWRQALRLAPVGVNQIEFHPFLDQSTLKSLAREGSLQLTAYRPIAKGSVSQSPTVARIARDHERTPVQVTLRWLIQQRVAAIPKAASRGHLEENFRLFDFELGADEMAEMDALARGERFVTPGWAPEWD